MRGDSICFVVGEYCKISGLLECSRGIFSPLFFVFIFYKKNREKLFWFKKKILKWEKAQLKTAAGLPGLPARPGLVQPSLQSWARLPSFFWFFLFFIF